MPTSAPKNSAGVTPTIVNGRRPNVIVRPTTAGSRAEAALPVGVTEHGDRMSHRDAVVALVEEPAERRPQPQQREVLAGHEVRVGRRLDLSVDAHVQPQGRVGGEVEHASVIPEDLVLLIREAVGDAVGNCCASVSRCSGSPTGSCFQITVLISVKSAVLAPMPIASESTAASGEAGGFRERPDRVADVLPGLLEPGPPPLGAGVFGGEREVAELAAARPSRRSTAALPACRARPRGAARAGDTRAV